MSSVRRLLERHPHWSAAKAVLDGLSVSHYKAFLAGGCVRDALLGEQAKDLDIATSATPDQISQIFEKTVDVGKSFGVIRVILQGVDLEVATFRGDGEYKDGRRPESVRFTDEKEDALRRDFTVNALFFDPKTNTVLDFVDGIKDLSSKILKTVGEPERRFKEDHLRLLRAVRFANQLDFKIEDRTWAVILEKAHDATTVSRERIRDELMKLLQSGGGSRGTRLLCESNLLRELFPALKGFEKILEDSAGRMLVHLTSDGREALARWLAPIAECGELIVALQVISTLRLSGDDEKFVKKVLETFSDREGFWMRPRGRRLMEYVDPAVRLAMELWDQEAKDPRHELLRVEFEKIAPNGSLPSRILSGDDLKTKIQGARLGEALRAAYQAQLEGQFHDRAAALTWFEAWIK